MTASIIVSGQWKSMWLAMSAVFGMSGYGALLLSLVLFFGDGVPYLPWLHMDLHQVFILSTIGLFFGGVVLSSLTSKSSITTLGVLWGCVATLVGLVSFAAFLYWVIVMGIQFFS